MSNSRKPSTYSNGANRSLLSVAAVSASTLLLLAGTVHAQTFSAQAIASTANIYGAGRTGAAAIPDPGGASPTAGGYGGGTAAPAFTLTAGTGRVLTFSSVTGTTTYDYANGTPYQDADGGGSNNTVISSYQGISGINFSTGHSQLVGVFVSGPPTGYADGSSGSNASVLSYSSADQSDASFSPVLNQTFFIGDGLTGDGVGATQQFFVPDTATTLVLGFADGPNFQGPPGYYNDNAGTLTTSFAISNAAAPEPTTVALLAALTPALLAVAGYHRRRSLI